MSDRHSGQHWAWPLATQRSVQARWKVCRQLASRRTSSRGCRLSRQKAQASPAAESWSRTTGSRAMISDGGSGGGGGGLGLRTPARVATRKERMRARVLTSSTTGHGSATQKATRGNVIDSFSLDIEEDMEHLFINYTYAHRR